MNSGIVDENVNAAKAVHGQIDKLLKGLAFGCICGVGKDLATAKIFYFRSCALQHILVNTVCLTNIKSAQTERFWRARGAQGTLEEFHSQMGQNVPLKRLGEPEEVGALVAFLVSEQARFITGTAINIDGGVSAVV